MKRGLKAKVRALGVLQVTLIAGIMLLLGVLFFNKMIGDQDRFEEGTKEVKLREAEGLAKLLALELGRLDALRSARFSQGDPAAIQVRAVLWEKVTFIGALQELDLIYRPQKNECFRPMGRPQACDQISDFRSLPADLRDVDRMVRLDDGVYLVPLYVSGSFWGLMRIGISDTTVQHTLSQLAYRNQQDKTAFIVLFIVCLTAAAIVLTLVLASFFRRIHRPLIALTNNAVAFGTNPEVPPEPVDADPEDEVGVLAARFEEMRARLAETIASLTQAVDQKEMAMREMEEKDQMLRRSERLASVGVLAAGVAHEIGNKLNPMAFVIHNLKKRIEKGKELDPAQLELLNKSVDSCTEIIDKLRSLARQSDQEMAAVDLNSVVNDVSMLLTAQSKSYGVTVTSQMAENLPSVEGLYGDLVQVLINLVVNARDAVIAASRDNGEVTIATRFDADKVVLEVADNGTGMSAEVRDHIFEPFFTTKGLATGGGSGGTGLGLYICYGILSRHGVEPEVLSNEGQGTRFVLTFEALN